MLAVVPHTHENPAALHFLAGQRELELPFPQGALGVDDAFRHPEASVPEHDGAAAILSLRNGAFEVAVIERMILHLDGEPLFTRDEGGALGHRPGLEDAVELQPQVVVQAAWRRVSGSQSADNARI